MRLTLSPSVTGEDVPGDLDVGLAVVGVRELLVAPTDQVVLDAAEQLAQSVVDAHVLDVPDS